MCGIFGLVAGIKASEPLPTVYRDLLRDLFLLSETRGGEAAGLAVQRSDRILVYKSAQSSSTMLRDGAFVSFFNEAFAAMPEAASGRLAAIGHCRLVTNGRESDAANNQPVVVGDLVGIHNGIVVNDAKIWRDRPDMCRRASVDSEVILALVERGLKGGRSVEGAVADAFAVIEGESSIALLSGETGTLSLATNTGSIYWARHAPTGTMIFASEEAILRSALARHFQTGATDWTPNHLEPGKGLTVVLDSGATSVFELAAPPGPVARSAFNSSVAIVERHRHPRQLRRCTRCILPETFPFITFDADGVCNFCLNFQDVRYDGREALERLISPHRRSDGRPDCIVAFSGGRDSCYGLHVIKKELGLNPLAFTYDWGFVTDLARRNQARICGKLGVEHIWRTADIPAKRRYVRANLEAWMRRPRLGMIPLFTAGDKEFYYHARRLRRETGIDLVFFCAGNRFEETRFKTGFAGVEESHHRNVMTRIPAASKVRLAAYYAGQVVANPRYVNLSLPDTVWAFIQTYLIRDDFLYLYHYMPWDESTIVDTLRREYHWEQAPDTETTWRIGDATASFYNYVYYTVAGFSEHDTFRSNQVRAGVLTREQALMLAERDNRTRYDAIDEYASLAGISANELHRTVNAMPKLGPMSGAMP